MALIEYVVLNNCRLCHTNPGQHNLNTDANLLYEILEYAKIKVNDNFMDFLPAAICDDCKNTIQDFHQFQERISQVDEALREILSYYSTDRTSRDIYKCHKCSTTFNNEQICMKHVKSHEFKFSCTVCNKTYSRERNYKAHLLGHKTSKAKENDLEQNPSLKCVKKFKDFNEENIAQNLEESNEYESGKIDILSNTLLVSRGAEIEENIGVIDSETSAAEANIEVFECTFCNEKFDNIDCLNVHKRTHHVKFVCSKSDCGKVCNSAYTLKTHELKHDGKRSFLCVTCGKGFITKNSLTCHEKIHLEVKGYTCKLCNIGFSVRSNLRAHEKKYHEGVRFYCSQCTKEFVSKCSLERHERIHTGIKEFQCESCPSAFYTNKELLKHQRYHQGLRLHKCDECFKAFFERHHLVIHLRSHTGERPYVCKVPNCGKSFAESQKLKRHHSAKHSQT